MTQQIGHNDALVAHNPATLEEIGQSPITTEYQLNERVSRARAVVGEWRRDVDARRATLKSIADGILAQLPRLAQELTVEQGKPLAEAKGEVWAASSAFSAAAAADWEPSHTARTTTGHRVTVQQRPFGVVAAIVPWNFPLYLAAAKLAPALLAGNAVLVKPAETVSMVVSSFIDVLRESLPVGVVDVVVGGPDTARQLIDHHDVRKVSFTGSTATGSEIIRQSAPTITPVTLELGGNDPAIILPGTDLGDAAARLAAGAFLNAGQMCIAPKRAYVPRDLVDEFAAEFADRAQRTVGDGRDESTTMGPLHNRHQLDVVAGMLGEALNSGARVITGGQRRDDLPGHFLQPTVLMNVDDDFDVVRHEQFGPVFPIVGYDDLDTVLDTLDQQEFGLGASVWSDDPDAARAVAERIDAGTVWINQHNALDAALPFGGVKSSGFGSEGGTAGVDEFVTTRVLDTRESDTSA